MHYQAAVDLFTFSVNLKAEALKWRDGGVFVVNALNRSLQGISSILIPHQNKKAFVTHFDGICVQCNNLTRPISPGYISLPPSKLLHSVKPPLRKFSIRTNLIIHKTKVMQQMRYQFKDQNPVKSAAFIKPVPALTLLRSLCRLYMLSVKVSKKARQELEKKRSTFTLPNAHRDIEPKPKPNRKKYRKAKAKLDLIHKTMAACQFILSCDSINHDNPKGCPKCGVLYRYHPFIYPQLKGQLPFLAFFRSFSPLYVTSCFSLLPFFSLSSISLSPSPFLHLLHHRSLHLEGESSTGRCT